MQTALSLISTQLCHDQEGVVAVVAMIRLEPGLQWQALAAEAEGEVEGAVVVAVEQATPVSTHLYR